MVVSNAEWWNSRSEPPTGGDDPSLQMTNPNRVNSASTERQSTGRRAAPGTVESPLRWTCQNFEYLQRRRIALREQLRAVLQERAAGCPLDQPIVGEPDDIIRDVA